MVLIKNGQWQTEVIQRMRVEEQDIMAAARDKGCKTAADIKYAVLERDGEISIVEQD